MQRMLFVAVAVLAIVIGIGLFLFLRPQPTAPSSDAAANPRHFLGPADAKVKMVDFSNYLCSHCQDHAANVYPLLKRDYIDTGKIQYIFREVTFAGQSNERAAQAAACAADANLFSQYHEVLFRSVQQWGGLSGDLLDGYLADLAGQIGMAPATLTQCLESGAKLAGVEEDRALATRVGVTGTPTFYVNGTQYTGARSYEAWKEILDKALVGEVVQPVSGPAPSTPTPSNP
ncbi:MAG: thioredoxin domain-containing protein [Meiothermus sp.]|nr:thioredoxin domain-containing protein [Meiothermus sp.]